MKKNILFCSTFFALMIQALWAQIPQRPVISHEPPVSVVAGQPLRIVARVSSTDPIADVHLYLAQSDGAAPTTFTMRSAGAGVYSIQIPPGQFAKTPTFRYYIDAKTQRGAVSETNWMTVQVIGQNAIVAENSGSDWKRPALIGAGALVAVGAGVAIAGGGGGDGGDDTSGENPEVDPADQVLVRTASDQEDSPDLLLPQTRVVDVAGDLAGRTITRVRIQLDFDAVDGGEEEYQVSYDGSVVINGRTSGSISEQVDVLGSADTQVVVAVTDSVPVNGLQAYSWIVTVTYFVE